MRVLLFVFAAVFMASPAIVVSAAPGDVTVMIADMPVSVVLDIYGRHAGAKITASEEVKALKVLVSLKIERAPKEEALKLLEEALAKQAGVEVVRAQDGSYSAGRLAAKK